MAKYYYNKYTVTTTLGSYYVSGWTFLDAGWGSSGGDLYDSYYINPSNGTVSMTGTKKTPHQYQNDPSLTAYSITSTHAPGSLVRMTGWHIDQWSTHSWYFYRATITRYPTTYSRGSLVESNIIAEDGTYPANGQSGGYWWVRGSAVPLPTVPSSITIPTEIKGGESFTVSWGASSYQTGYRLERQLNGGSWVQIVQQAGTSYVDTVDKGTLTVNYRVMSYGTGGNSGYRTGTVRNVINFPEIFENYNGVYTAYEGAWENVNGTWVEIDSVWENVNGVWVEL